MPNTYTINATGKKLGRVASEAAKALMGKTRVDYTPNRPPLVTVVIDNASELDLSEKKRGQLVYKRYSGYPSGQRIERLGDLMKRRSAIAALRKTIERMLPRNTLRKGRMKHLVIREGKKA